MARLPSPLNYSARACAARRRADRSLARRCDIWAGGIGLRWQRGVLTQDLCYRLFTADKRAAERLGRHAAVPHRLRRHGTRLRTDISARQRPSLGAATITDSAPLHPRALLNTEGNKLGTFSAWGVIGGGQMLGVAAGHFVAGADRLVDGRDHISAWVSDGWVPVGRSRTFVHDWGDDANPANYGVLDAGSFSTHSVPPTSEPHPVFVPTSLVDPWARGLGMRVFGEGAVSGPIEGVVTATLWEAMPSGLRADLLIEHPHGLGLTAEGDSGMIWNNIEHKAIGMHVLGENRLGAGRYSIATYMFRVVGQLGLRGLRRGSTLR